MQEHTKTKRDIKNAISRVTTEFFFKNVCLKNRQTCLMYMLTCCHCVLTEADNGNCDSWLLERCQETDIVYTASLCSFVHM
jgi:uncharacterized protein YaiI (UPF0178 family)